MAGATTYPVSPSYHFKNTFFVSLFFDSGFNSELGDSDKMMITNCTSPGPAQDKEEGAGAGSLEDLLQIFRIFKLARSET